MTSHYNSLLSLHVRPKVLTGSNNAIYFLYHSVE